MNNEATYSKIHKSWNLADEIFTRNDKGATCFEMWRIIPITQCHINQENVTKLDEWRMPFHNLMLVSMKWWKLSGLGIAGTLDNNNKHNTSKKVNHPASHSTREWYKVCSMENLFSIIHLIPSWNLLNWLLWFSVKGTIDKNKKTSNIKKTTHALHEHKNNGTQLDEWNISFHNFILQPWNHKIQNLLIWILMKN